MMKRDWAKQGEKTQIQQIVEVLERNLLDSWPEIMQEEIGDQTDTTEACKMMIRMSED